jgi:hypothetical protein
MDHFRQLLLERLLIPLDLQLASDTYPATFSNQYSVVVGPQA